MKFLEGLRAIIRNSWKDEFYQGLGEHLESTDTKRILFDSRQASLFADLGDRPPQETQRKLVFPFEKFYLELTESIKFGENVPTENSDAILDVMPDYNDRNNNLQGFSVVGPVHIKGDKETLILYPTVFYFTTGADAIRNGVIDFRGFYFHLESGRVFTQTRTLKKLGLPSVVTTTVVAQGKQPMQMAELSDEFIQDLPEGKPRQWCENIRLYGGFVSWVTTYMTAKGITIEPARLTRAQRKQSQRAGDALPWYQAVVDPRVIRRGGETGSGPIHGHRYDVRAHLRFGRHKRKDGTYSHTVEVIQAHQRGLANEKYVPRVSKFKGGREMVKS